MLNSDEIKKIFSLSRLSCSEKDLELAQTQINSIISYVETLQKVDTTGVIPMSHVHGSTNVFREDTVESLLTTEQALSNAPDKSGNFIRVPLIIETV